MAARAAEGKAGPSTPVEAAPPEKQMPPAVENGQDEEDILQPSGGSLAAADSQNLKEIMLSPRNVENNRREESKNPLWRRGLQLLRERLDIFWSCRETRKHLDANAYEKMKSTYWTSRIVFLRALGIVYFMAFLISFNQAQGLIGSDGILPAKAYAEKTAKELVDVTFWEKIKRFPSLFLLLPANDFWIHFVPFLGSRLWLRCQRSPSSRSIVAGHKTVENVERFLQKGCVLSLVVALKGGTNACLLLVLWILYQSVFSIGQAWYGFAWEVELLEMGFLSIFISPFWSCSRLPRTWPVPLVGVWGCRWLLFRLLLGSGLAKLRSTSSVWKNFSALNYFYFTQPLPNPFAWYFHNDSHMTHAVAAVICLVVECVAGFLLLLPIRSCRLVAASAHLLLQCCWALGGNYAFLTWCSCLPALLCLDDHFLSCLFSMETLCRVEKLVSLSTVGISWPLTQAWPIRPRTRRKQTTTKEAEEEKKHGDAEAPAKVAGEQAKGKAQETAASVSRTDKSEPGAEGGRGADESTSSPESTAAERREEEDRTCWCWYRPAVTAFFRRCAGSAAAWREVKEELRQKWLELLAEVAAAAALLTCMQLVALATPAAVWLVVVVFFLAAGLATSSVFLTQSWLSHVFVEVVLLLASLQSAINLYTNGPAVWSVWICCCLVAILLIFAFKILENAALIFKLHVEFLLLLLIVALSVPVVKSLLSPEQIVTASVEGNLNILNTYGMFGTVAKWFLPLEPPHLAIRRHPWFLAFLHRLLKNTPSVTKLLAKNPFKRTDPPTALRVLRMKYFFSPSSSILEGGPWWVIDTNSTRMFTLPTEVPGAVEHLQEMRELYYRRGVAMRQRQLQEREEERRRLERRAFEERHRAALAEEKKRKAALAAAKRKKAEAEAARKKEEVKRKKEAAVAVEPMNAVALQRKKLSVEHTEELEKGEPEKRRKEEKTARRAKEAEEKRHAMEAEQHEKEVRNHFTDLVGRHPPSAKTKQGAEAEREKKRLQEITRHLQSNAVSREIAQRQKEEVTKAELERGKSKGETAVMERGSKKDVNLEDEGVPLRAAPLLSRRVINLVRQ